jgi:outer membrane protein OmpA-like peptidoglycan-associated protein
MQRMLQSRSSHAAQPARVSREPESERQADKAAQRRTPLSRQDFSGVKIHTDPEAAETVDSLGARALTYGRNIFFGPGEFAPKTKAGDELAAHEMAHVQQQLASGRPAVQFAPKKRHPGIGANPPKEAFVRVDKPGPERDFVLFKQDSARLSRSAAKALVSNLKAQGKPLLVKIYGYASSEGGGKYNVNLSAHRAVAMKSLLQNHLPAGSKIELYAHGETSHFGAAGSNRRAGIWFGPLPAGAGTKRQMSLKMRKEKDGVDLVPPPVRHVIRDPLDDPTFRFGRRPSLLNDFKLDWRGLNEPGAFRGVRLDERDARAASAAGRVIYGNMLRLGLGSGVANWWTNRVLQSTYDARLALENPTLLDLSAGEMLKFDPNFSQIVVPVMTPEIMNWVIKKTFKRDIEFRF